MAVVKPTISLDPDLHALVERLAAAEGVSFSAWTAEALRRRARHMALGAAIAGYEAEHGPFSDAELDETAVAAAVGAKPARRPGKKPARRVARTGTKAAGRRATA